MVLSAINDVLDARHESLEHALVIRPRTFAALLRQCRRTNFEDAEPNFEDSLPVTWKLVSTSRIPVDGSRVVSVGPMLEKEALHSRQYSVEKQASLQQEQLQSITKSCACNRSP